MALEKQPLFIMLPADGAIGAHMYAVQKSYEEFEMFTKRLLEKVGDTPMAMHNT